MFQQVGQFIDQNKLLELQPKIPKNIEHSILDHKVIKHYGNFQTGFLLLLVELCTIYQTTTGSLSRLLNYIRENSLTHDITMINSVNSLLLLIEQIETRPSLASLNTFFAQINQNQQFFKDAIKFATSHILNNIKFKAKYCKKIQKKLHNLFDVEANILLYEKKLKTYSYHKIRTSSPIIFISFDDRIYMMIFYQAQLNYTPTEVEQPQMQCCYCLQDFNIIDELYIPIICKQHKCCSACQMNYSFCEYKQDWFCALCNKKE